MTIISCPKCDATVSIPIVSFSFPFFSSSEASYPVNCEKCDLKITGKQKPEDFYASVDLRKVSIVATAAFSSLYYAFKCVFMLSQPWSTLATLLTGSIIWYNLKNAIPSIMRPIENKISEKIVKSFMLRLFYDPQILAKA